jgi:hypothetical protein
MAPDKMLVILRATSLSAYHRETDTYGDSIPLYLIGILSRNLECNRDPHCLADTLPGDSVLH